MILPSSLYITNDSNGLLKTIKGSTKKLGANYSFQRVCLYSSATNQLMKVTQSDESGHYQFEVNSSTPVYVIAFDSNKKFNAVIQDNVRPK